MMTPPPPPTALTTDDALATAADSATAVSTTTADNALTTASDSATAMSTTTADDAFKTVSDSATAVSTTTADAAVTDGNREVTFEPVPDWSEYVTSSHGWVYRVVRSKTDVCWFRCLAAKPDSDGYRKVTLSMAPRTRTVSVHILVAHAHLGDCPPGMSVDHSDQDKLNNDISNLRYATPREQNLNRTIVWKTGTGASKRREIRTTVAFTLEFEDWPDMETAVRALMPEGKSYASEKNDCYIALRKENRSMQVYGRHWTYVSEYSTEDWTPVSEHLLPDNRKWPSGWEVTRTGKIRSPTGKILGYKATDGHWKIQITRHGMSPKDMYVHDLVLHTFAPASDRTKAIWHKNGDYLDTRLENLELLTQSEYVQRVYDTKPSHGRQTGVQRCDLTGKPIGKPFKSFAEANKAVEKDRKSRSISYAIKQGHGVAHGYIWKLLTAV